MLVSDVIQRVKDITADVDGTRWSDSRLIREINAAQFHFCTTTNILRDTVNLVVSPDQSNYTIPYCDTLLNGRYNNIPLSLITTFDLDKTTSAWETEQGEPKYLVFNNLNRSIVRLYPTPNFEAPEVFDLETANTLNITYTKYPKEVLETTDILEVPDIYLEPLVYYITGNLFRSDLDSLNRQFGAEQFQLYNSFIAKVKASSSKSFTSNPDAFTTIYRRF